MAELAAEDLRRRKQAESELARKEAALRSERAKLEHSEAAVRELEAAVDEARRRALDPDGA